MKGFKTLLLGQQGGVSTVMYLEVKVTSEETVEAIVRCRSRGRERKINTYLVLML